MVNLDWAGCEFDGLAVARQIIGALALNLDRRILRRDLLDQAGKAGQQRRNRLGGRPQLTGLDRAALGVVGIPFLSDMGAAAAFTVLIAVLIALTLLPAILGIFGRKAFAGKIPFLGQKSQESEDSGKPTLALRYISAIVRRPLVPLIGGVVLLGALALPATGLSLSLPSEATGDPATSSRQAYDLIDEGFGGGKNGPLLGVIDAQDADVPAGEAFEKVVSTISGLNGAVRRPAVKYGARVYALGR